nr:short-chain dehydrogenase cctt [Quercus suber]
MSPPKTVLITGCSPGGIGHALAREFHSQGLRVFATARNSSSISDLAALGIETLSLEVTSATSISALAAEVSSRTNGALDILVNNAGRNYTVPVRRPCLRPRKLSDPLLEGPRDRARRAARDVRDQRLRRHGALSRLRAAAHRRPGHHRADRQRGGHRAVRLRLGIQRIQGGAARLHQHAARRARAVRRPRRHRRHRRCHVEHRAHEARAARGQRVLARRGRVRAPPDAQPERGRAERGLCAPRRAPGPGLAQGRAVGGRQELARVVREQFLAQMGHGTSLEFLFAFDVLVATICRWGFG